MNFSVLEGGKLWLESEDLCCLYQAGGRDLFPNDKLDCRGQERVIVTGVEHLSSGAASLNNLSEVRMR